MFEGKSVISKIENTKPKTKVKKKISASLLSYRKGIRELSGKIEKYVRGLEKEYNTLTIKIALMDVVRKLEKKRRNE